MIDITLLRKLYPTQVQKLSENLQALPEPKFPIVTQSDAENGYIYRYFIRLTNDETFVMEIDRLQYDKLKDNSRFITTQLRWKIVGKKETYTTSYGATFYGVEDINRKLVISADLTFGGLTRYIRNYLEYWVAEG